MKKRNPLGVVGLSIVTFGIYDIYWLYVTKKELNEKTSKHTPTLWMLFVGPILLTVSYILIIVGGTSSTTGGVSTYGSATSATAAHTSALVGIGFILVIISWLITFALSVVWYFKFSKAIDEYTNGKMSTAVTFLILYLIHLIGVALIQDTFNDMMDSPAAAGGMPQAAPMPPIQPVVAPVAPQTTEPAPGQPVEVAAPAPIPEQPVTVQPAADSPAPDNGIPPTPPTQPV